MVKHDIKLTAIHETELSRKSKVNVWNYTVIRKDRDKDKTGGLAFLIHDEVKFHTIILIDVLLHVANLETQAIVVTSGEADTTIVNVYTFHRQHKPPTWLRSEPGLSNLISKTASSWGR